MSDSTRDTSQPIGSEPPLPPEFALPDDAADVYPNGVDHTGDRSGPRDGDADASASSSPEPGSAADEAKPAKPRLAFVRKNLRPIALLLGIGLVLFSVSMITSTLRAEGVDCGSAASPRAIQAEGIGLDGVYEQAIRQNACNDLVYNRRTVAGIIALVGIIGVVFAMWRRKDDNAGWKKVAREGRGPAPEGRAHLDGVSRDRAYPRGRPRL